MANAHIRFFYGEEGEVMFELVRERLLRRTVLKKSAGAKEKANKWDGYIPVIIKFIISHIIAVLWLALSIYLSRA